MSILSLMFQDSEAVPKNIRAIPNQKNELWFVLKDVLEAIGTSTPVTVAVESIKQGLGDSFNSLYPVEDTLGRVREVIIVHQNAVRYLIANSRTEQGKALNRFLFLEVLPQIAETGGYSPDKARPPAQDIKNPLLAALAATIQHLDQVEQQQQLLAQQQAEMARQQAALLQEQQLVQQRLDQVEIQHRSGVPQGYLSKRQAHELHGQGLSEKIFHKAMTLMQVRTQPYLHTSEDGYQVPTVAYFADGVVTAIERFVRGAKQVTKHQCEHPLMGATRFMFKTAETHH